MPTRDARNTRFFWMMLVVLGLSIYVGLMYVTTGEDCGTLAKEWQFFPPHWVCLPHR